VSNPSIAELSPSESRKIMESAPDGLLILNAKTREVVDVNPSVVKKLVENLAQEETAQTKRLSDIGTLAAAVAHELRNPLAAINIATQNIRRKKQDLPIDKHLESIEKKVIESDQIISNLLFCSRLRLPRYESVDVRAVLADCIAIAKKRYQHQKTKVIEKIGTKSIVTEADPMQLKEVFNNVLNNAFDATSHRSKGQIDVQLSLKEDMVQVFIKDNGGGISPENLKKVKDPFFTTKAKGTGLGLTVCYQIVKLHNGRLDLQSKLDKGTSITIQLPQK
jgi:signal transduction histidine kinase